MRKEIAAACLAAAIAVAASCSSRASQTTPDYKVTATVALGAPDRWDYVVADPFTKRVYVAHGTEVSVVDARTLALIGTIGGFPGGTHGIGISPATGTGFTDDGKAGVAVPFDLATLKTGASIPTAADADGIVFDPASHHILVVNGDSGSVTVIDPARNAAVATIDVGAALEFGVVDGRGKFYVDGAANHDIVRIDTATNSVDAHWPMPSCRDPRGIAIDSATRRIFATCANKVMVVVDADTGRNIVSLPIGGLTDGAAFDPARGLAFSANGDGTMSVVQEVDANTFASRGTVKTVPGARTMAIDPATGRLFLVAADIAKIDPPATPGGRPRVAYVPGSLKLFILDPKH